MLKYVAASAAIRCTRVETSLPPTSQLPDSFRVWSEIPCDKVPWTRRDVPCWAITVNATKLTLSRQPLKQRTMHRAVAFAWAVLATSAAVGTHASLTGKVVGTEQFTNDYQNCYDVFGVVGDKSGHRTAAMAWSYSSGGDPCFGTGATSKLDIVFPNLTSASSTDLNPGGSGGDQWTKATRSPFSDPSNGTAVASFPSNYGVEQQNPASDAAPKLWGVNELPWMEYTPSGFTADPSSHSLYYIYTYFMQGGDDQFAVVRVDTRNPWVQDARFSYSAASATSSPQCGLAALPRDPQSPILGPPGVAFASDDGFIVLVTKNYTTNKVWSGLWPNATADVFQMEGVSDTEVLMLYADSQNVGFDGESTLARVDVVNGKVVQKANVGNATAFVTGWNNVVALAGHNGTDFLDATTLSKVGHVAMPHIGPYAHQPYSGVQGSFATGFPGDKEAYLYLIVAEGVASGFGSFAMQTIHVMTDK